MTGRQRYRANALIKKLCANYDDGNCLLLDEGEGCVCVQSISYSLLCRYFRNAVLPADPALEAEILGTHPDRCVSCGCSHYQEADSSRHHNWRTASLSGR
ncbi:MAG: cysteine-rich VLP domain-containing protein [Dysgonomonas sp.]